MTAGLLLPRPRTLLIAGAALAANAALVLGLERGLRDALLVVLLPVLFVVVMLLAAKSDLLVFTALALPMTQHSLNVTYPIGGGVAIWVSDIVAGLAAVSWLARRFRRDGNAPVWDRPAILGWPLVLFAAALTVAEIRGHQAYGTSLFGQPLRYFLYAVIAVAVVGLDARKAHRGIVAVFYLGTVWMMINAAYYIATGKSQSDQALLSTGGSRYLSGTVSVYMGAALFLALLNLQLDSTARRRGLHLAIAILAGFGVVLGYFRAVYIAVGLVLPVLLVAKGIRRPLVGVLPLALPFLLVLAIAIPRVTPTLVPDLVDRVTKTNRNDPNLVWRLEADRASAKQFYESPLYGVGFGRSTFVSMPIPTGNQGLVVYKREQIGQGAHNAFLWMLAGGGVALLGAFLLLIGTFLWDSWRRLRFAADPYERVLIAWSLAGVVLFLIPELSGPPFDGTVLLGFWVMLLLPGIVPRRDRRMVGTAAEERLTKRSTGHRAALDDASRSPIAPRQRVVIPLGAQTRPRGPAAERRA